MTPTQREIAAKMIEAKGFSLSGDASADEVEAASFVFDQGIFFMPEPDRNEVIKMLRESTSSTSSLGVK